MYKIFYIIISLLIISMILRLIHFLLLKKNNLNNSFNKYNEISKPTDIVFQDDTYDNFQFFFISYKKLYLDKLITDLNKWTISSFNLPLNYIISNIPIDNYIYNLYNTTKPSQIIKNTTHLVIFFPKENKLFILLDHYYCDGFQIINIIQIMFNYNKLIPIKVPKYKYLPIVSDFLIYKFLCKNVIYNLTYPTYLKYGDKQYIMHKTLYKNECKRWDRWNIYAKSIINIYECSKQIKYLKIGLTVAIDGDKSYGNNRIGIITVIINKPNNFELNTHEENVENLTKQFKLKVEYNKSDCINSYDLLKSYDTTILRKYFSNNFIDIVFSSFKLDFDYDNALVGSGGFLGNTKFYICAVTVGERCIITITTKLKDWDREKFLSGPNTRVILNNFDKEIKN